MPASTCALALPLLYPSSSPLKGVSRGTAGGGGRLGWPAEGKATLKTPRPTQEEGLEKPLLLAWVQHRRAAAPSCPNWQVAEPVSDHWPLHPTPPRIWASPGALPPLHLGAFAWGVLPPIHPGALPGGPPPLYPGGLRLGRFHPPPSAFGGLLLGVPPPLHLGRLRRGGASTPTPWAPSPGDVQGSLDALGRR